MHRTHLSVLIRRCFSSSPLPLLKEMAQFSELKTAPSCWHLLIASRWPRPRSQASASAANKQRSSSRARVTGVRAGSTAESVHFWLSVGTSAAPCCSHHTPQLTFPPSLSLRQRLPLQQQREGTPPLGRPCPHLSCAPLRTSIIIRGVNSLCSGVTRAAERCGVWVGLAVPQLREETEA